MDAKAFGSFLAALRKEKQMTQKQLAEQLHVTDKAVSKWERGAGLPDLSNMETLAEVLGITLAELIQCKRQEEPMVGREELDQVASIAMELAEYQRRDFRRRLIWGLIFCGIGAFLVFAGAHSLMSPVVTVIGGADGPTSIFLAGKLSPKLPTAAILIGCAVLAGSVWMILRNRR